MKVVFDFLSHADLAGRLRQTPQRTGFSAFSAAIEKIRCNNPEGTVLLDAGDQFSANLWGGLPVVEALNLLGTDAFTLGNHEFDKGPEFLEECVKACRFPVLCANIQYKESGKPVKGTLPYTILERQGVKIGVLGVVTEYTPYMVEKDAFEPFQVTSAIEAGNKYIPELREKGAEIVVVLAHLPFYIEDNNSLSGELWDLLTQIPPVDICIGGHIPGDYAQIVNDTCVLKSGFSECSLGHAKLVFDLETRKVVEKSCNIIVPDRSLQGDPTLVSHIKKVTAPFEQYLSEPLAQANESWPMTLARESKLGDFLVDCLRFGGETELAYMNATSAGGSIEPGPVTRETIVEVCGFNDPVCVGEISGEQLYQLIEMVYEPERFGNNASLLISGFKAELDHTKSSPHKVIKLTLSDGTPIERDRVYSVATSAYMASGGNDTAAIAKKLNYKKTDLRFHDAAFAYAQSLKTLEIFDYPRLKEIGTPENDNSPF